MARPLKKFVLDHTKCWVNIGIKSCEKEVMLKKIGYKYFWLQTIFVSQKFGYRNYKSKELKEKKIFEDKFVGKNKDKNKNSNNELGLC